ncbi:MAG: DUF881 domain-containing protein [Bacillaceae bacterium]|nr:DUF881 domain-containing protein [Bacillaceae bacterium]
MASQKISFSIVTIIIGFMIAVQFQSVKEPVVRDTRDTWQLRSDLKKEQEIQSQIITEIRKYEEQIRVYEEEKSQSKEAILRKTLEELKKEAGLTIVGGPGIKMTVNLLFDEEIYGYIDDNVSAELLRRFINELNSYDVEEIAIAGQRIVNSTVLREVNGRTKINNTWLPSPPFEIVVTTEDPTKLYNRLQVSRAMDEFAIENFLLQISTPINYVTVPAYEEQIRLKNLETVKLETEGN